jgi:hypothetical protein
MAATWVERHKLNNSLLVFIHGIFGDATNTWRGIPHLLQNDFASDPRICSYDSYLFEYPSTLFNQLPFDPYILDQFDLFLKGLADKYQTTVLGLSYFGRSLNESGSQFSSRPAWGSSWQDASTCWCGTIHFMTLFFPNTRLQCPSTIADLTFFI